MKVPAGILINFMPIELVTVFGVLVQHHFHKDSSNPTAAAARMAFLPIDAN